MVACEQPYRHRRECMLSGTNDAWFTVNTAVNWTECLSRSIGNWMSVAELDFAD